MSWHNGILGALPTVITHPDKDLLYQYVAKGIPLHERLDWTQHVMDEAIAQDARISVHIRYFCVNPK